MAVKVLSKTMDSTKLSSEKSELPMIYISEHRTTVVWAEERQEMIQKTNEIHSRIRNSGQDERRRNIPPPMVRR